MKQFYFFLFTYFFFFTSYSQTGAALDFDYNTSDFVFLDSGPLIKNYFTVEAWVKPGDYYDKMAIISTRNGGDASFEMQIKDGNTIHCDIGDGTGWLANVDASFNYTVGIWYHLACSVTPKGYKIYVNGNLIKTGIFSGTPLFLNQSRQFRIGSHENDYTAFKGQMDEVRIWNRELSKCEIENNKDVELSSVQIGLSLYYKFNQGEASGSNETITTLTDSSGNNYNASLYGFNLTGETSNWVASGAVSTGSSSNPFQFLDPVISYKVCRGARISEIGTIGSGTIKWYDTAVGGTPLDNNTLLESRIYYVSQCDTELVPVTVTFIPRLAPPVGPAIQIFTQSTATLNNLTASGKNIRWFDAARDGTQLASSTVLTDGATYYAENYDVCESISRLRIKVRKISEEKLSVCNGETISNVSVSQTPGATVQWYSDISGGTALSSSTALVDGKTYYIQQDVPNITTVINTGNPALGIAVDQAGNVYVPDPPGKGVKKMDPFGNNAQILARGVLWPEFSINSLAISPQDNIYMSGHNHWVRKMTTWGSNIETISQYQLTYGDDIAVDTDNRNLYLLDYNSQVRRMNTASGSYIAWYSSSNSINAVAIDLWGNVYQADAAKRVLTKVPDIGGSPQSLMAGFTLSDLATDPWGNVYATDNINNDIKKLSPDGTYKVVASLTNLSSIAADNFGNLYVTGNNNIRKIELASTSNRVPVTVAVKLNSAPAAASPQTFCRAVVVADLAATGTNLKWYTTAAGNVPLAATAAVTTGTYYVTQTTGGCESERRSVRVYASLFSDHATFKTACGSYDWNGTTYTASGVYTGATNNCITEKLNLTILPVSDHVTAQTSCGSYIWNGTTYTASGIYTGATNNCITEKLDLTIIPLSENVTTQTSCGSYVWNGTTYTASGVYTGVTNNCVTEKLDLTIIPLSDNVTTQTSCGSYIWNGMTYTASGIYTGATNNCITEKLDLTIIPLSENVTTQTACGSYIWNGTTYTASGVYTGVTNNCVTEKLDLTIVPLSDHVTTQTSCGSYDWNGTTYTASGIYTGATNNCVTEKLDLTIIPLSENVTTQKACGSYDWNGTTYTASGVYTGATNNCVTEKLDLTIIPLSENVTTQTACGSYIWNGTTYTASGVYTGATNNCITEKLDLTIIPLSENVTTQTSCGSYVWNGTTYTASGVYTGATNNCITEKLDLTIIPLSENVTTQTSCGSYVWNGTTYTASGVYTGVTNNCVTEKLDLTIIPLSDNVTTQTSCGSYIWNGMTYTASGIYTGATNNCITEKLDLTIIPLSENVTTQTACGSYIWNGTTYTASGVYTGVTNNCVTEKLDLTIVPLSDHVTTQTSCGSYDWNGTTYTASGIYTGATNNCVTEKLDLTIIPLSENVTTQKACGSYDWNGTTYTASGVYTGATNNCVTEKLDLTIIPLSDHVTTQTACGSYVWNGTTYTASGVYTGATNNCVTEKLDLTIIPVSENVTTQTACGSYIWNGTAYTASGVYTGATNNCVTEKLDLTIIPVSENVTTQTACGSYIWNGTAYTASGVYTGATNNCVTEKLDLTIIPVSENVTTQTACGSYIWNGTAYTASGVYTGATNNCVTEKLDLTIIPLSENVTTQTACGSYVWNGTTYTASGVYTGATNNCVTEKLDLTIIPLTTVSSTVSAVGAYKWAETGVTYSVSGVYNFVNDCYAKVLDLTIIPVDKTIQINNQVITSNQMNASYQWWDCENEEPISNETGQIFIPKVNGNYKVQIFINDFEIFSDCMSFKTLGSDIDLKKSSIKLYPNPSNGIFIIELPTNCEMEVFNVLGNRILNQKTFEGSSILDISNEASGVYLLRVREEKSTSTFKIIKK